MEDWETTQAVIPKFILAERCSRLERDLVAANARLAEYREALEQAVDWIDGETCHHEETVRGGAIWTICSQCGLKWADDQGGFQPYTDPEVVAKARALLARDSAA